MSGLRLLSSRVGVQMLCKLFSKTSTHTRFKSCLSHGSTFNVYDHKEYSTVENKDLNVSGQCAEVQVGTTEARSLKLDISSGPSLMSFMEQPCLNIPTSEKVPYLPNVNGNGLNVYFEVYGCQMNVNDTEIIWAILTRKGYVKTDSLSKADIVLLITCAIRDNAENKIWARIGQLDALRKTRNKSMKLNFKIGILGCMAERLKHKLIEKTKAVDIIAGPDSYKDLPRLLAISEDNVTAINVQLSADETYADITPVRLSLNSKSAFVSIMRGCNNMCTYCIVPFTRGRERSRPITSILDEVKHLSDQGVKEVTLLGQNVNSYRDTSESAFYVDSRKQTKLAKDFRTVYKPQVGGLRFSDLLDKVSLIDPEMRIRFTSPHPKDFPDEVLHLIAERPNICRQIHLPAQSGNSSVLERMRRGYSREAYLDLVAHIRDLLPDVVLSSDFIAGFCGETEDEFEDTLSLIRTVKYNSAFLFAYSMREKTTAHHRLNDDVPRKIKHNRMQKMTHVYRTEVEKLNMEQIGQHQLILIEGSSKRSHLDLQGRNEGNIRVIIHNEMLSKNIHYNNGFKDIKSGDYVVVQICHANSQTLIGVPLYHSSISEFSSRMQRSYVGRI
ncbi:CDK5 regulatory subunit-associated protein 1 [Orussus abietinus]|uniref:CDK5 regulatory subunit-associated protein 1 n=1 Tax=Orussus abietinus TaxID=222816 RepID=UPI000625B2EC|nr:CDK5 regulatory subunit-associated protein 1 [Orussus abietinus]XP_012278222.1 CDK5 regulatory subunit-associated protein 1 [Orussus abietinus]